MGPNRADRFRALDSEYVVMAPGRPVRFAYQRSIHIQSRPIDVEERRAMPPIGMTTHVVR